MLRVGPYHAGARLHSCRPCESRDPYAVPSPSAAEYGSRLFGRDDSRMDSDQRRSHPAESAPRCAMVSNCFASRESR
jgi:hypothetical protein